MREAVIVAGVRTPIGRAQKGALKDMRADDLAALVIKAVLERAPGIEPGEIDDVILGCALPEGEQGLNIARIAAIRAGLPTNVPGFTVNRFCSSGLQAIAIAAERVMVGGADIVIAGGVETMSRVPMMGHNPSLNPTLVAEYPQVYMGMGHTAEEVARRFGVSREDQDRWALESHRKAAAAIDAGRFKEEIVPVPVRRVRVEGGKRIEETFTFDTDECVRRDTSLEKLAQLKPVFRRDGTVTAGNSAPTNDGAAAVIVMAAEEAARRGLPVRAVFRSFAVGGVDPDIMGVGPVVAVPKALKMAGVRLEDVDLIELNEAFAAQVVQVVRELELDPARVNVNGGAIALGHPLGCTGARQVVTLMHEAARRQARYGVVT
ncbi:MAG: acetyl-CoA C-acyltransferase, partial [Bacillota bacterium]